MAKIVMCVKHGKILFSNMGGVHYPMFEKGVCDKCRSEKIDKVLSLFRDSHQVSRRGLKERIKEWCNDVNIL